MLLKSPVTALPLSSRLGCMYWTEGKPVLSESPLLMSKGSVWLLLIWKSLSSAWRGSSAVTQNFHEPWTMNKSTAVPAKHKHAMTAQVTLHENVAMRMTRFVQKMSIKYKQQWKIYPLLSQGTFYFNNAVKLQLIINCNFTASIVSQGSTLCMILSTVNKLYLLMLKYLLILTEWWVGLLSIWMDERKQWTYLCQGIHWKAGFLHILVRNNLL